MAKKIAKAMKIPSELIYLGRTISVTTDTEEFKFALKDKVDLYSSTDGKSLWCLQTKKKVVDRSIFEKIVEKRFDKVKKSLQLYEKWHEFESSSGSILDKPKGFLHDAGRVVSIVYQSDKWTGKKQKYIHTFKNKPKLRVNRKKSTPTVLSITGGKIRVKNEGITG